MFKKANEILSTMVIVLGTSCGNFSHVCFAEEWLIAGDREGMTNTVKVKTKIWLTVRRILEGKLAFQFKGWKEPVDLVVVWRCSGVVFQYFSTCKEQRCEGGSRLSDSRRALDAWLRIVAETIYISDGKSKKLIQLINDMKCGGVLILKLTHEKNVISDLECSDVGGTTTALRIETCLWS